MDIVLKTCMKQRKVPSKYHLSWKIESSMNIFLPVALSWNYRNYMNLTFTHIPAHRFLVFCGYFGRVQDNLCSQ